MKKKLLQQRTSSSGTGVSAALKVSMPRRLIWRLSSCVRRLYSAYAARLRRATWRLSGGPWQIRAKQRACAHTSALFCRAKSIPLLNSLPSKAPCTCVHGSANDYDDFILEMDACQAMQQSCCMAVSALLYGTLLLHIWTQALKKTAGTLPHINPAYKLMYRSIHSLHMVFRLLKCAPITSAISLLLYKCTRSRPPSTPVQPRRTCWWTRPPAAWR